VIKDGWRVCWRLVWHEAALNSNVGGRAPVLTTLMVLVLYVLTKARFAKPQTQWCACSVMLWVSPPKLPSVDRCKEGTLLRLGWRCHAVSTSTEYSQKRYYKRVLYTVTQRLQVPLHSLHGNLNSHAMV
jgi:hypothetical protein